MIKLEKTIKTNGSVYHLLKRSKTKAVYKQYIDNMLVGYEMFPIPVRPEEEISGKVYPKRECYPNTTAFGKTARAYGIRWTEDEIIGIFNEFEKNGQMGRSF